MSITSQRRRSTAAALAASTLAVLLATGAVGASSAQPNAPAPIAASVADDDTGPQLVSGVAVDISDDIVGDVYASGQSVTISGDVTGDVIAAGQTVLITGTVDGDVRLAGQSVTVSGDVTRSATIFASDVTLTDAGSLGDDMVGAAGTVTVAGDVGRDMLLSVGSLTIDGSVGGDVTYYSDTDARIAAGAVDGQVERVTPPQPTQATTPEPSPGAVFVGWLLGLIYALVALSLVTLAAGLLAPRWLARVTDHLVPSPWKALLVGFVAAIAVPTAVLFLLVTIVGAPLALAVLLVWFALTLATFVHGAYYLGRLLLRGAQPPVVKALVGGAILIAALQIPWLNVLVWLAMVLFGLGAQLLELRRQRPWARTADADAAAPPTMPAAAAEEPSPSPTSDGLVRSAGDRLAR